MHNAIRSILLAGLGLLPNLTMARADTVPDRWQQSLTQNLQELKDDRYISPFGYSVAVPSGATGWVALPINSDRGVLIVLGSHRTIDVSGEIDQRRYHNTHEYLVALIHAQPADHLSLSQTTLGGQAAEQAHFDHDDVRMHVIAQHLGPRADARDYSLVLTTDAAHQAQDEATFATLVKGYTRNVAQK